MVLQMASRLVEWMVVKKADWKVDSLVDLLVVMKAVMMAGWKVDMMENMKVEEMAE